VNAPLSAFLATDDPRALDETLSELVEDHARPIVRRVVSSRLAGRWDDVEDVCSEAKLELLLHLRRAKAGAVREEIRDFPAYVAAIAANACRAYFRRRRPGRARLWKQIRVLLAEHPEIRLRTGPDGIAWIEFAGRTPAVPRTADRAALAGRARPDRDLGRLLVRIVEENGGAIDLESAADVVARIWRIPPDPVETESEDALRDAAAETSEPEISIDNRRYTVRLWQEIRSLPREQRFALLLNLRDGRGNSALVLFPLTGAATFREVSAALDLSESGLASLWNDLPSDDLAIAGMLGCSRQRVINLRMSARKRLANRMKLRQ
jgi:DNA-directed RNA polymerase specialized sigma24 family protein